MALERNKFDRAPYICAAGKPCDYSRTLKECLTYHTVDDKVAALKHEANIPDKMPMLTYKLAPLVNSRHQGIFTEIRNILGQPSPTRFQTLVNDIKETSYKSYWCAEEGKIKDPIGKLPLHIDPLETIFGIPRKLEPSMKELINPDKNYDQVLVEFMQGHEMYKKTHNDYYPSERKDRKYLRPAYNPKKMFGEYKGHDSRGMLLKCITQDKNQDNYAVVNTIRSDFQSRFVPQLGKALKPNRNEDCVPKGQVFGLPGKTNNTLPELLTKNKKPKIQEEIEYLLSHINPLRTILKKRFNKHLFSFSKFLDSLRYWDKNKTGWIPLSKANEICRCFSVYYDRKEVERFLTLFGIIRNDQINYFRFVDLLNWQVNILEIIDIYNVPPEIQYYETSYNAARNDYKSDINTKLHTAGLPSSRYDLPEPIVPVRGCRAYMEHLGAETEGATIMYPSIYVQHGLSFYDLFQPRNKDEIRKIFQNSGYVMDNDTFEKLWNEAYELDTTGQVCAATFKKLVKTHKIEYKSLKAK